MGVISDACRKAQKAYVDSWTLETHPRWRGAEASYRAKHYRIVSLYGKATHCENKECKHPGYHRFEWANLDGEYTTDRSSWAMLCVYCHRNLDRRGIAPLIMN